MFSTGPPKQGVIMNPLNPTNQGSTVALLPGNPPRGKSQYLVNQQNAQQLIRNAAGGKTATDRNQYNAIAGQKTGASFNTQNNERIMRGPVITLANVKQPPVHGKMTPDRR